MRPLLSLLILSLAVVSAAAAGLNEVPGDFLPQKAPQAPAPILAVPGTMAFQGFLTDDTGAPLTDLVNLDLALYGEPSGGTAVWSETQSGVDVVEGIFAIGIGSESPLGAGLFDGSPLFLGIRVNGEPELAPRTELRTSPYAFRSFDTDNLGGLPPSAYLETAGGAMSGPLGLYGGIEGLEAGGITEVVASTENVTVRKYFLDSSADSWDRDVFIVLAFNGTGETPAGGPGTATVYLNDALHTTIAIPGQGGRPWTYIVDLGAPVSSSTVDVRVRATNSSQPVMIHEIAFHPGSPGVAAAGNTLDDAYDEGGAGAGRSIAATAGAVEITGPGGLDVHGRIHAGVSGDTSGLVNVYHSSVADPVDELTIRNGGGAYYLRDATGTRMLYLETDSSSGGSGAWFGLYGSDSFAGYVTVDGNAAGSGDPLMKIHGSGSTTTFDTRESGNSAVAMPADAISAQEMFNEPGMSQGRSDGNVNITETTTMEDVVTTTITIPAAGYIQLAATAQARITSASGSDYIGFQIDETAGGSQDNDYYQYVGWTGATETGTHYLPLHAQRTYYKTSAGSYTFRLEARDALGTSSKYMWNPVITATYIPTGYGTVTTRVAQDQVAGFQDVRSANTGSNGPGTASEPTALVDLRELELRVAREEARLEASRRRLAEAQNAQNGPELR